MANPLVQALRAPAGGARPEPGAIGGAIEGADRFSRETALWRPSFGSPDRAINQAKSLLDARGRDMALNDGWAAGAVTIHKDSIVGAQFRLNAKPSWKALAGFSPGFDQAWAEEFQSAVEERFTLAAESGMCWLDASRRLTLTEMVRLQVGVFVRTGEMLATAEWIRELDRPFHTAVQVISPDRLCNPDGRSDDRFLRRGVEKDTRGRPVAFNFRTSLPFDNYAGDLLRWVRVPAAKPWGRKQVLHVYEQDEADQSRGIASMTSVLKKMRMLKRFSEVTLQNAVVNATFAAAIESELPSEAVAAAMGAGANPAEGLQNFVGSYLTMLNAYLGDGRNVAIDGVKIPHFLPGTKLNIRNLGTPGGVGTDFEASLLRHVAAGLGVSYEELAKDYSKVSYASGRLSITNTERAMQAKKAFGASRFASDVFSLWLEEDLQAGNLPLPARARPDVFYRPLAKEAFTRCTWIGTGRGQTDELKETQAALLRIQSGLSTREVECAKLGFDFREILDQLEREKTIIEAKGLVLNTNAARPLSTQGGDGQGTAEGDKEEAEAA